MKYCSKCKTEKEENEFYKDKRAKDKLYTYCKDCHLKINKKYLKKYSAKYQKEYRENNKEYFKLYHRNYRKNSKENIKRGLCRHRSYHLVEDGKIQKKPCEICGNKKVQIHHNDYNNPFDFIFLCRKHHFELHKKLNKTL
jgi:hypothetical protein